MGRAKIPRKSTNIDMTAMCDVAFLLLSFFILATKQKPPEAVQIDTPSSVSNKVAKEKAIVVNLAKDGKVYLMLNDETTKKDIVDEFNTLKNLQLPAEQLHKLEKADFIGLPSNKLESGLKMSLSAQQMDGIPCADSLNNELRDWMRCVNKVYTGKQMELLVKGDNVAKYPIFRNIIDAFLANDITKFKLITSEENVPLDSELYKTGITKHQN